MDLNNRPGGPNLIVTAKTAHKVHFLDAATLTLAMRCWRSSLQPTR